MHRSSWGKIFSHLVSNRRNTIYFLFLTFFSLICSLLEGLEFAVIATLVPGGKGLSHGLQRFFEKIEINIWFFLGIAALLIARAVLNYARSVFQERWRFEFETEQRERLLKALIRRPLSELESQEPSLLVKQVDEQAASLASVPDLILKYGVRLPAAILQLLFVSWLISWHLLVILSPVVLIFYSLRQILKKQSSKASQKNSNISNFFQGLSILKIFGAEESFLKRYFEIRQENQKTHSETLKKKLLWGELHGLLMAISILASVSYVFFVLKSGLKEVFLLVGSLKQLHEPLKEYSHQKERVHKIAAIITQLKAPPETKITIQTQPFNPTISWQIELDSLSFAYGGSWRLKPLSLSIKAGEKIALVGSNGAGKSTLLKLLAGLYVGYDGHICFHGIESFSQIGYVVQKPFLFSGTVRDNIAFYQTLTETEIEEAAWQSCAADFIHELPQRYESIINNDGTGFSGGQRQKIHLARSFARKTPILLLDEATASLDIESEARILANCRKNTWQTQIVVSHRKEILSWADRVIELDKF